MRTSRSASCMLASVSRAWPRSVLITPERRWSGVEHGVDDRDTRRRDRRGTSEQRDVVDCRRFGATSRRSSHARIFYPISCARPRMPRSRRCSARALSTAVGAEPALPTSAGCNVLHLATAGAAGAAHLAALPRGVRGRRHVSRRGHAVSVIIWLTVLIYWLGGFFYRLEGLQVFILALRRGAGAAAAAVSLGAAAVAHAICRRSGCTWSSRCSPTACSPSPAARADDGAAGEAAARRQAASVPAVRCRRC